MEDTAERLDQTVSVTNEQREAADNVAAALAEIRDAAEQLSADQEERVALAKQIEALVAELEAVHRKPARTSTSAGGGAPSGRSVAVG
jgi:predicted  nucleic acid-binding Zn-ribbon protein